MTALIAKVAKLRETAQRKTLTLPKQPRHFAADVLALPEADREAAIVLLPADVQASVRHYVLTGPALEHNRITAIATRIAGLESRQGRRDALAKVPVEIRRQVETVAAEIYNTNKTPLPSLEKP